MPSQICHMLLDASLYGASAQHAGRGWFEAGRQCVECPPDGDSARVCSTRVRLRLCSSARALSVAIAPPLRPDTIDAMSRHQVITKRRLTRTLNMTTRPTTICVASTSTRCNARSATAPSVLSTVPWTLPARNMLSKSSPRRSSSVKSGRVCYVDPRYHRCAVCN